MLEVMYAATKSPRRRHKAASTTPSGPVRIRLCVGLPVTEVDMTWLERIGQSWRPCFMKRRIEMAVEHGQENCCHHQQAGARRYDSQMSRFVDRLRNRRLRKGLPFGDSKQAITLSDGNQLPQLVCVEIQFRRQLE